MFVDTSFEIDIPKQFAVLESVELYRSLQENLFPREIQIQSAEKNWIRP